MSANKGRHSAHVPLAQADPLARPSKPARYRCLHEAPGAGVNAGGNMASAAQHGVQKGLRQHDTGSLELVARPSSAVTRLLMQDENATKMTSWRRARPRTACAIR